MEILSVKNLKMYYETLRGYVKAVDDVTFGVDKREALGLAGESGCGKTSTVLAVLKLLPWNAKIIDGSITMDGFDLVKASDSEMRRKIRWKKISMIFQGAMNALHPTYTIKHQITEPILAHEKIGKEEAVERASQLVELVGLEPSKINRYPHELSGGMKQRVIVAMALACNPTLVIADEPTTALDVIVQAQVLKVMKELQQNLELSWILITHDLSLIAETCHKVAIMYAGKIVEYGSVADIFKEPLHPYTRMLIAAFPSVVGTKKELSSIHGFPPDLLNPPTGCRFHPRCPHAMEICKIEDPLLAEETRKVQYTACHLYGG